MGILQKKSAPQGYYCPVRNLSYSDADIALRNKRPIGADCYNGCLDDLCKSTLKLCDVLASYQSKFSQSSAKCTDDQNQAFARVFQEVQTDLKAKVESREEQDKKFLENCKVKF